jgi:hypothetical protein
MLRNATRAGHFGAVKAMIEGMELPPAVLWEWTPQNRYLLSPLFTAIMERRQDIAMYLLSLPGQEKYNKYINVREGTAMTILHAAAAQGYASVVKKLVLTRNANINVKDHNGHMPTLRSYSFLRQKNWTQVGKDTW